jgi:hypothetical protein
MPIQNINQQNDPNMAPSDDTRVVLYAHGYHDADDSAPALTRYHRGEWRPAMRQYIYGNPVFSHWRSMHGTHTFVRTIDRTNAARAAAKPIRLWDAGSYPASLVPTTYIPNPSQLSAGNVNSTLPNTSLSNQDAYSAWYGRFGSTV